MRRILFVCVALLSVPCSVRAQGSPVGPEFRVNTYTYQWQQQPSVAGDASGNFVVVWTSRGDGSLYGVFGQRYSSSGAPIGPEFRVNTFTTDNQIGQAVAADPAGNFVVVWHSYGQDGSETGVFGQRYASSGAPLGSEFRVNTYTTDYQDAPAVAAGTAGDFVVVWDSQGQVGSRSVFGQRYASSGAPVGPEFRVNTFTGGAPQFQTVPSSVALDPSGNFVVAWQNIGQDGSSYGVFGQRFASSGAPVGPEFRVNTYTPNYQVWPSIFSDPSGDFVLAWTSYGQDGFYGGIYARRYASSGAPLGPEFRVNTYTTNYQRFPSVAGDGAGNFIVTWFGDLEDGSGSGVFGQRFASSGTPLGPEFRVNTYTTAFQAFPSVAADTAGNFVVVWYGFGTDPSGTGVFGQRYSQIVPVELMQFRVE
jgi:hypothetical protein